MKKVLAEKLLTPESTLVEYITYDHGSGEMRVKYLRGKYEGKERKYSNIPPIAFQGIEEAKSKGKEVLKVIAKYRKEKSSFFSVFKTWFNSNIRSPY